MRQARLNDLACDQRLINAADAIIEQGSCAVSKPVRAGMTTSTIMACERRGQRVLALAPTRRILQETVGNAAAGQAVRIPGNSECPLIEPDLKKNPILRQLPLTLPNCQKCSESDWCEVLAILRAKDPHVMALTYPKLEALMLSRGKIAQEIRQKIGRAEVVLLDECHELALPKSVSVKVFAPLAIPDKYGALARIYQQWLQFCQNHAKTIQELMELADKGHSSQHLSRGAANIQFIPWKELKVAWSQLRKLAVAHAMPDEEILQIRDIITIMSSSQTALCYISEEEGESGSVYVTTGQIRQFRALNEFLTTTADRARLLFVSGTNFEPHPGYFAELSGREIKHVIFPDIRHATKKMTLIPDRWKLTSRNFAEKLPVILETIKAIAIREKLPIYLLAPNGRKARWLQQEIAKLGLHEIFVDYYRSDHSLGVARGERVCITVGMAEIPANACDALAHGKTSEDRWLDSRRLRLHAVHAATWQAVNRVRDPVGMVESRAYFIGCRLDQVRQAATWGNNRQAICREIKQTKGSDGKIIRTPVFEVRVDEEIVLPKIYGNDKNGVNPSRRALSDFISQIELYNSNCINSGNQVVSSININRENDCKHRIYNIPKKESDIDLTSTALYSMFVNRTDCYAKQYKNSATGRYEFYKVIGSSTIEKIKQHVTAAETIGVYEIGLDDTVTWCCDDIDSHNGETDSREKVGRLVETCRTYNVPFLLEASGSVDSYHLWILLSKTRTYNAYRFIRQLNSESKVDCECWPKQKSLRDKNGKYGNLIKLPVCFHQKSGGWSAFIDADTFEPLEGPIPHPGLVHLLEIPDLSESSSEGMPKVSSRHEGKRKPCSSKALDYCMQRALEDKIPLEGSEGHYLRLAIAVKAQPIGLTAEATAQLFQSQKDYDHDFSLSKVLETWSYAYSPMSCETLRDKCGKLVKTYCQSCPFCRTTGERVAA